MNKFKLSALALTLSASVFAINAQAAVLALGPDTNASPFAEQYQFSDPEIEAGSFTDYILLSVTPYRDLTASLSSTSDNAFTFDTFGLYTGDINGVNTLVQSGTVGNIFANLSFGGLTESGLGGSYFLKVTGTLGGTGSYNGNITLATAVPEPETYGMMAVGLGLMGFVARRRKV